jgi:hypothetical protein
MGPIATVNVPVFTALNMVRDGECRHTKSLMVVVAMRVFVALAQEFMGGRRRSEGARNQHRERPHLVIRAKVAVRRRASPRSTLRNGFNGV